MSKSSLSQTAIAAVQAAAASLVPATSPTRIASSTTGAYPTRLTLVQGGFGSKGPAYVPAGRPAGVNTGSAQLVATALQEFALELGVPLAHITDYDPVLWAAVVARVTGPALENVYARLAQHYPHPTAGSPANAGPDQRWVAGFIDGDGCLATVAYRCRNRRHEGYRLRLDLGCNDPAAVQDAHAIMGARGKIYRPRRTIAVNRQMWRLVFDGIHTIHALCAIAPFMRVKGTQATALLAYWFLGRQWVNPGPRGTPPAIRRVRRQWHRRIAAMK